MKNALSFKHYKADFAAGLVVFLVALPLCLGIALASGAPLFSGIISGVIGGCVVGFLSSSHVSVSGPAAGLTAIVLSSINDLGSLELFMLAVVLAGVIQVIFGYLRAGTISNFFPNNVIEGMLGGIGVIIFLKQIPHAFGYDRDTEGDFAFVEKSGSNTITTILNTFENIHLGSTIIFFVSLIVLLSWDRVPKLKKLKLLPGALVVVISGILINVLFDSINSGLSVKAEHLVSLPKIKSYADFIKILVFPDFHGIANTGVWITAATIAVVASMETLLCIEAGDRMDKHKRYSDGNTELKAQGIGNIASGLLGGLPMTSVVVRTSANINSGAQTKLATIIHGVLLLISVLLLPSVINMIPLSSLAAILILIGYKLARPEKMKHFWSQGKYQFVPFIATLLAVVFIDLLNGVAVGMMISILAILRGNIQRAYNFRKDHYADGDVIHIDLAQEVSFLNKAAIKSTLSGIPKNSSLIINASDTVYIAHDVLDLIRDFKKIRAKEENIKVTLVGFKKEYALENTGEEDKHVYVERP